MPGHVFIVRGDLRRLACDAWLMPCSRSARPEGFWFLPDHQGPRTGERFEDGGPRVQPLAGIAHQSPRPWLTRIGKSRSTVQWYVDGAIEFLQAAAAEFARVGEPPLFKRSRPLLALPVVGTGMGGAAERAGEVVQGLLPVLESFCQQKYGDQEFDVALVCWEASSYAAAQAERAQRNPWPTELTAAHRIAADQLAQSAMKGDLALFLGAGVSVPAGVPNWPGLLDALAMRADMTADERVALNELHNAQDQATIIERRLAASHADLGTAVRDVIGSRRHQALPHMLLAALPVREVVTTNYDQLFDDAWALSDPDGLSVLPGNIRPDTRRWLLKMHGSLLNVAQIVLTRSSYTRYDDQLPALSGILQAFLITRHMLFVGFSLTDDNFHRIVDAVRRLREGTGGPGHFGTTLTLGGDGLAEVLWEKDIRRVRMDDRQHGPSFPNAEIGRRLEIFLDYMLSRTRNTAHLLVGKRYDSLLTDGERILRDALARFASETTGEHADAVRQTVAWPQIHRLLASLGFDRPNP